MTVPDTIGVVGAGTMGWGIAQLGAFAGARVLLHDPDAAALGRGLDGARAGLERWREKGRLEREPGELAAAPELGALAPCGLIVEAAPERLELKRALFGELSRVAPGAVLASNTSSIPITAIAGAAADPSRVVGMHFFNPAPLMRLVEVVAGVDSGEDALAVARATGAAMGRRVIDAADVAGFLVNRVNRPFGLEALKLLAERIAGVEDIDRIVRLGGGFRMGPFELQDLVGIDVGLEVARSFHELSFGEPRWRPSPLSAQMVAAGRHGRKTGRGWYGYGDGPHRPEDPAAPAPGGGDGRAVTIALRGALGDALRARAAAAGWRVDARDGEPWLTVGGAGTGPAVHLLDRGALHEIDPQGVGFHVLLPLPDDGGLVELARTERSDPSAAERAEAFFTTLGLHTAWVGDAPGLVLGRIVCQLVNEAAFAVGEGVGSPEDVDAGLVLGLNHPRGPFAWLEAVGVQHVVGVLDALHEHLGEERYRVAPLLRRRAML